MALIVEDGTKVTGANSYVSDADYVAYAAARGVTIGADATTRKQELIKAMDFLESYRDEFKGTKLTRDQALQWPRYEVWIDSYAIDSDTIPDELKNAQMEAAILSITTSLSPSGSVQNVQSESIGNLSVSYYSGGSWQTVQHKNVDRFLGALINSGGKIRSLRV